MEHVVMVLQTKEHKTHLLLRLDCSVWQTKKADLAGSVYLNASSVLFSALGWLGLHYIFPL